MTAPAPPLVTADFVPQATKFTPSLFLNILPVLCLLGALGETKSQAEESPRSYVIVVDTSGSMLWSVKGRNVPVSLDNPRRIEAVKPPLITGIEALPEGTPLTLIEFSTGVKSVKDFILDRPETRESAIRWVRDLSPDPRGDTHLWAATRRSFEVVRGYLALAKKGNLPARVLVRIYTDGENDDKSAETGAFTLQQVLADFPEIDGRTLRPDLVLMGPDLKMETEAILRKEKRINVISDPELVLPFPPVIVWRPDPIMEGQKTSFLENSKSPYVAYEWMLDGKLVSKEKVLDVPTLKAGTHVVSVEVRHPNGLVDFSEETVEALVPKAPAPDPAFDVNPHIVFTIGETLTFSAREQKEGWQHEWLVNGLPLPGSGPKVEWTGDKDGETKVSHRVTFNGESGEATITIVGNKIPPPEADFEVLPDVVFHPGDKLTFRATQTKPDWKHEWLLDDGVKLEGVESTWTADKAGRVKITHRITSTTGIVEAQQTLLGSEVELPDASFSATPRIFTVGENVTLQSKTDKPGWQHEWTVQTTQGNLNLKGAQAVWKSDTEGKVIIIHTVTDGGTSNQADDEIAGRLSLKIVAKFKASPRSGTHPLTVQFTDASTPPEQIAEYTWDFGDGTPVSHEKNPVHVYEKVGRYPVKLQVTSVQRETVENAERMEIRAKPTWVEWLMGLPLWVKLLAGLLVIALLWKPVQKLIGAPLVGRLEWRFGSVGDTAALRGKRSFHLGAQLAPALKAGWKPRKKWVIRNKGGKMKLFGGAKPQALEPDKPVSVDGMTITFKK